MKFWDTLSGAVVVFAWAGALMLILSAVAR